MVKSVLALLTGLALMFASVAGYAYVRLNMSEETESGPDTGVAACEAILGHPTTDDIDQVLDDATIAGLKTSTNADLQAAGETMERLAALPTDAPIEEQMAAAEDLIAGLAQIAAGCAAVGVPLPNTLQPNP